ncbi:MAG: RlmE family RNA methyltransferase [Methanomassiliicoccales archaeon]|nr:RlmE family RNA methyltransferase [Methanomassiliicoccales archaeon]
MSKRWLADRRRDPYYRKAKQLDYRSRASFKLIQIDDKFHLLRPGAVVTDLGAAPGGWLQVAAERVGPKGKVVGVDLQPIEPIEGVITIQGDMRKDDTVTDVLEVLGGKVDVVLSDMSPNISGSYSMDHARSVDLCEHAFEFAERVLRKNGSLVMKIFEGDMMQDFLRLVKARFTDVRLYGPDASRSSSSEIYIVAKGFTG